MRARAHTHTANARAMVQMSEDNPQESVLSSQSQSLGLHDSPLGNLNSLFTQLMAITNVCCMFVSVCVYALAMARGLRAKDNFVELVLSVHFCLGSGS